MHLQHGNVQFVNQEVHACKSVNDDDDDDVITGISKVGIPCKTQ